MMVGPTPAGADGAEISGVRQIRNRANKIPVLPARPMHDLWTTAQAQRLAMTPTPRLPS
jgi:hypothetical protein